MVHGFNKVAVIVLGLLMVHSLFNYCFLIQRQYLAHLCCYLTLCAPRPAQATSIYKYLTQSPCYISIYPYHLITYCANQFRFLISICWQPFSLVNFQSLSLYISITWFSITYKGNNSTHPTTYRGCTVSLLEKITPCHRYVAKVCAWLFSYNLVCDLLKSVP